MSKDLYVMRSTVEVLENLARASPSEFRANQKYELLQERAKRINPSFQIPYIELWPAAVRKRVHLTEGDSLVLGQDMTDQDVTQFLLEFIEEKPSVDSLIWAAGSQGYDWEKTFSALQKRYNLIVRDLELTLEDIHRQL